MAFNGLCTRNDMLYASEGCLIPESRLILKAPKSSYKITSIIPKDSKGILEINYKPTKETFFDINLLPNFIKLSLYSIPIKNNKRIITLYITNKSISNSITENSENSVILYCHENETDLIRLIPFLIDISLQLKVDIVSFDYQGFGDTNIKPKISTIFSDGEETLNFVINYLHYKIENITLLGKEIGSMCAINLASKNNYHNCKSLVLCMPILGLNSIDIKVMRSIICKCLLIMEIEDKEKIDENEIINLCREIPNEKEWLPIKKNNKIISDKFKGFKNFSDDFVEDVYTRHRSKFILKLKNYIYNEESNIRCKNGVFSSIGGSTDSETHLNLSMNKINNFDDVNDLKNKKEDIFNETEIKLKNDEDY